MFYGYYTRWSDFDIDGRISHKLGLPIKVIPMVIQTSDVVFKPVLQRQPICSKQVRDVWIIDFGVDMPMEEAALYELPFEYVKKNVYPVRTNQ